MSPRFAASIAWMALVAFPGAARPDSHPSSAAEALFDEGRALVQAGRIEEGCAKLAESQRLEPAMGTQFNLADCYERLGRIASARALYRGVEAEAARAGDAERASAAQRRAAALEPRLHRLRVTVRDPAPGLAIARNGENVPPLQWGAALPFDPGRFELTARANGFLPWFSAVVLSEPGVVVDVEVPPLEREPSGIHPHDPPGLGTQRIAALALGGVAISTTIVGTITGVVAIGKAEDAEPFCPDPDHCTREGLDLVDEARGAATISTVSFAVALAAAAGGVVLWLTAPDAEDTAVRAARVGVGVAPAGARIEARW